MPNPCTNTFLWAGHLGNKTAQIQLQLYVDLLCPFAVKLLSTFLNDILPKFGDKFGLMVYHYCQAWINNSGAVSLAAIAARQLNPDQYANILKAFCANREHIISNTETKSYNDIIQQCITFLTPLNIDAEKFKEKMNPTTESYKTIYTEIKFHQKFGRQNSIHVTPSVCINGFFEPSIGSSLTVNEFEELLKFVSTQMIPSKI